ncbi:MAG: hypothetical protein LAO03_05475 [Acidobacteriia bacterium]|nr:hypothetical protein [Terriglobia bacterium]
MKKHLLTLIFALGLMAALTPTNAAAQMPNMDMSWAMRSQLQLQRQGDYTAHATAMAYYNYMLRLRRMGYTGPSLPTGVTPDTLRASMQRLQQSMDAYHASSAANSDRTSNAINNWDYRAVRGCQLVVDYYGQQRWYCP